MADDAAIRRANLRRWAQARQWGATELAANLYGTYSYWRDLLTQATKPFGEKAARRFEDAAGLPRMWLDDPDADIGHLRLSLVAQESPAHYATPRWPWSLELWTLVAALTPEQIDRAEAVLRAHLGGKP